MKHDMYSLKTGSTHHQRWFGFSAINSVRATPNPLELTRVSTSMAPVDGGSAIMVSEGSDKRRRIGAGKTQSWWWWWWRRSWARRASLRHKWPTRANSRREQKTKVCAVSIHTSEKICVFSSCESTRNFLLPIALTYETRGKLLIMLPNWNVSAEQIKSTFEWARRTKIFSVTQKSVDPQKRPSSDTSTQVKGDPADKDGQVGGQVSLQDVPASSAPK